MDSKEISEAGAIGENITDVPVSIPYCSIGTDIASSSFLLAGVDLERSQALDSARREAWEIVAAARREVDKMKEEVEEWQQEKGRIARVQAFANPVKLDIGGTRFTTSLTTLCRFPDSMIGVMFSGRHEFPLSADGYHFIDRDGTHFRHILNFLRDPENFCASESAMKSQENVRGLRNEAVYYGLEEAMFPVSSNARICNSEHIVTEQRVLRASIGGLFLHVTASLDAKRCWRLLPDKNIYSNPIGPVVATCCRVCGSAYIHTQSFLSPHIGIKNFLFHEGRVIVNEDEQPRPEPRSCPTCRA
jgi:hypothetical protein